MEDSVNIHDDGFELGELLGRRKAFGAIAGRCSAADVECMRRIRDCKLYLSRTASWEEFCPKYLGISKTHANRTIRILDELRADYFALAQLTHISPEEFRAIASAVKEHAIVIDGDAVALVEGNLERVAAAVAELRRTNPPQKPPRMDGLQKRCREVVKEFTAIAGSAQVAEERTLLLSALREMRAELDLLESKMDCFT